MTKTDLLLILTGLFYFVMVIFWEEETISILGNSLKVALEGIIGVILVGYGIFRFMRRG